MLTLAQGFLFSTGVGERMAEAIARFRVQDCFHAAALFGV